MPTDIRVRLLESTCHGQTGQEVTVSASRARDLIKQGRAEDVATPTPEVAPLPDSVPEESAEDIHLCIVRFLKPFGDARAGQVRYVCVEYAKEIIGQGLAEQISE